jgi:alcohol dehydrogenase class IV
MIEQFSLARTPLIHFGAGSFSKLPTVLRAFGPRVLLVTGAGSLDRFGVWPDLEPRLRALGLDVHRVTIAGEPSPEFVDRVVSKQRSRLVSAVCSIGGGSAIDAGKAISAMLGADGSVVDFLEGVGTRVHPGSKIPFIAVPTTAGTGSEATRNAVIGRIGPGGFKRSLRHDNFVPDVAIVDPQLAIYCPAGVTAACGMDALTQLIESYVSPAASVMTDALVYTGIQHVRESLVAACTTRSHDAGTRSSMAYAALISGIALANAGLGIVHAFAATIGGSTEIPHGVVCGSLLAPATRATIRALRERAPQHPALGKYACIGALLSGDYAAPPERTCDLLVKVIEEWTSVLRIPRLGAYGITADSARIIAVQTSGKRNCIELTPAEVEEIVLGRV